MGVFEILWRGLITVYRSWVSPGNMKRCGMYPNCSRYFRLATLRHGGPIGCMMSADRLMRDNGGADSARHYPRILTPHGVLLYDPIEENDFWFRGRGDRRRGAR